MIGILTFFQGYNYGAFLQAYALQNYLLDNGHKNIFINYRKQKSIDNELDAVLRSERKNLLMYARMLIKIAKFKYYQRKFHKTKWINKREDLEKLAFDAVIIGSDQIWCYSNEWGGIDTPYFSNNLNSNHIISYAASMGPDKFDARHPRSIIRLMKNFRHIGVRDNNTYNFAKQFSNHEPQLVLDPTLLYDFKNEIKKVRLKNYILFYSDGLLPQQEVIDELKYLAKENNLKIVSVGKKFDWCDLNIISPSPLLWMGYVKYASFVFTCMYHGLLFSVKFNKQFAMFLTAERENKCLDFLKGINLQNRRIMSANDLNKSFNKTIKYEPVNDWLKIKKESSAAFLKQSLLIQPDTALQEIL
jgi:hypothetical protein